MLSENSMGTHKFLFVIPTLSFGGAERVVSVLSGAICNQNQSVTIIKYYECDEEYRIDARVRVINLSGGDRKAYSQLSFGNKVKLLRASIKAETPDFIIPFMFSVAQTVNFATIGLPVTVIQSIRINPAIGPESKTKRLLRDYLVYRSKCTFVQNNQQKEYFKLRKDRIHVLYNPISEYMFDINPSFSNNAYTVCAAGRLEKQKNFKLLIDSFCEAFPKDGNAVLMIYGDGSLKDKLTEYVSLLERSDSIQLMGRTDHIEKAYECSDLFVLSSDFEGMPNALIEAMACGLPSIYTDCPTGPSDLIEDGKNGLLVPMKSVDAMSQAILRMYSDREKAIEMGQNARETIRQKCDADAIAIKMIEVCESIK